MKKIVLTGTSCSGKTTLISELSKNYLVISETSRELMSKHPELANTAELQGRILEKQLQKEESISGGIDELVFFDRGIVDIHVYSKFFLGYSPKYFDNLDLRNRYDLVFLLETIPPNMRTRLRGDGENNDLDADFIREYRQLGYNPIRVPVMGLNERIEFILKSINPARR